MNIVCWLVGAVISMGISIGLALWIVVHFWGCGRSEIIKMIKDNWTFKEVLKILAWLICWPVEFPIVLLALAMGFIQPFV